MSINKDIYYELFFIKMKREFGPLRTPPRTRPSTKTKYSYSAICKTPKRLSTRYSVNGRIYGSRPSISRVIGQELVPTIKMPSTR